MLHNKIIKRIPGNIIEPPPREKQGYIDDLSARSKAELLELLERQDKLIGNRSFILKLPDKGEKIKKFRSQIAEELQRQDEVGQTCELLSSLSIGKSNISDEIEWTGKYSKDSVNSAVLDSDDESDDDRNPLKILGTQSGAGTYTKQHKIEAPEPSLIKPEDLQDIDVSVLNGVLTSKTEDEYVKHLCDKFSKPIQSRKEPYKPYRTTKSTGNSTDAQNYKKPLGPHWEVTAATPPPCVHGDAKLISLQESLGLQKEQAAKLKDIQAKHAAEKLASQLGLKMSSALPDPSIRVAYREDAHTDSSNSSEDEMNHSDAEEDDEPPEKDGAVVYNIVD